jgi:hypothetical protein
VSDDEPETDKPIAKSRVSRLLLFSIILQPNQFQCDKPNKGASSACPNQDIVDKVMQNSQCHIVPSHFFPARGASRAPFGEANQRRPLEELQLREMSGLYSNISKGVTNFLQLSVTSRHIQRGSSHTLKRGPYLRWVTRQL